MKKLKLLLFTMTLGLISLPTLKAQDGFGGFNGGDGHDSDSVKVEYGCMDPHAVNYDSLAQKDNGTCVYNDSTTEETVIYGCMDSTALNYNPYAKISNNHCIYTRPIMGCTDSTAENYNPDATANNGRCRYERTIWGCTDKNAMNYNPDANRNNGNCRYDSIVVGCTDSTALNFNPMANVENGRCIFSSDSIYGCTDPDALNYNRFANDDNGNCKYETVSDTLKGCMDSTALNFNPLATVALNNCVYVKDSVIFGCKAHKALNYNPHATRNDGSCVFARPGHMVIPRIEKDSAIVDTLTALMSDACGFDYSIPIDTAYIVSVQPQKGRIFNVTFAIVQDTTITNVTTTFNIQKYGRSLLFLSLVCNQGSVNTTVTDTTTTDTTSSSSIMPMKVAYSTSSTVQGATVGGVYIDKAATDVQTVTAVDYGIKLFPNPVINQLNVSYVNSTSDNLDITIYSIDGKTLMSEQVTSVAGANNFVINTSALQSGLHFMTVSRNGQIISAQKFAKF